MSTTSATNRLMRTSPDPMRHRWRTAAAVVTSVLMFLGVFALLAAGGGAVVLALVSWVAG